MTEEAALSAAWTMSRISHGREEFHVSKYILHRVKKNKNESSVMKRIPRLSERISDHSSKRKKEKKWKRVANHVRSSIFP